MERIRSLTVTTILTILATVGVSGCATTGSLLDGQEKSFLVVGYSTSYAWPQMLQDMLDEHADGPRTYHVLNAAVGGSPVDSWTASPDTKPYNNTIKAMLRDYMGPNAKLRDQAPEPKIALCQQSLQFTRTLRGPIASADDLEGIRIGADAFDKLAQRLKSIGLENVYIATHIYKQPVEPEIENEKLALNAVLARGHSFIHQGPDVWTPTKNEFPKAFAADGIHPNERGMKLMAAGWYRRLAGPDACPTIIDRMYARDYDVDTMMRTYIASRQDSAKIAQANSHDRATHGAKHKARRKHRGKRPSEANSLKVGQAAPSFTIKRLEDKTQSVSLANFKGKRPVVLFFGSYT